MAHGHGGAPRGMERSAPRDPRRPADSKRRPRRRLDLEPLEQRWLPTLSLQFADAVGVIGAGSVDVQSNAVANDSAGNLYVTGSLQGTANFSPSGTAVNLTSAGNRDIFFAKYSASGALVWAHDLRGGDATSVGQGAAIAVDSAGDVYLSGTFTGTTNFDPGSGSTSFTATGRNDVFVAKYDPNGNLLWAQDIVGTSGAIDQGYAIAVDGSGNVVAAGSYQNSATFGTTVLTAGGLDESFVTKLNPSGQFLWAKGTTGSGSSVAQAAGVAIDASGNVISTGYYTSTVNFNPGAGVLDLPQAGSRAIFVQKLDANGNLVWAQGIVGTDINQANSVAADASGNLYVTGTFTGTVNFDANGGTTNLTAGGYEDPFVLKLSPAGQIGWARDLALTGFNFGVGTGVAVDGQGNVFATGYYEGVMTLDPSVPGASITSAGGFDVFLAQFDASGTYVAAQSYGGASFDAEFGIGVNGTGQVALAGRYTGPALFGSTTLPAEPNKSIFVASVASQSVTAAPPPAPLPPVLESGSDTGLSNTDGITSATTLTFDVAPSNPAYDVVLYRDGVQVASRFGPGALTDPGPVPDGTHVYTISQIDTLDDASPQSVGTSITVDTSTPATPTAPTLLSADDSGVKGDNTTNVTQPRLTGKIDPLSLAQLIDATGNVVATAMAGTDGTYTLQVPAPLADGSHVYQVREESVAGNLSATSAGLTITILTHAATPTAPTLLAADNTGAQGDNITNIRQPSLTGSASNAALVQIVNTAGVVLGSASVAGNSYVVQFASPMSDGVYTVSVQITDIAGNVSAPSPTATIQVLATPPPVPSTPTLLSSNDSGTIGDNITNDTTPHLIGTAAAGTTVQLVNASGAILGVTTTGANGNYSVQAASPFADGTYVLHTQAIDVAGNVSAASGTLTLTILTATPATPATPALLPADDSGTAGGNITNVKQPHLIGTAAAGTTVQLVNASGAILGVAATSANGGYSVQFASPLADGTYVVHAQAIDVAGNVSAASGTLTLTILTATPATPGAPALLAADDTGTKGDGITLVSQPHLTGAAPGNAIVQIVNATGTVLGSGAATAGGVYTIQVGPLSPGTYVLDARTIDAAGNLSAASAAFTLTIQASAQLPATPSTPSLLPADNSGAAGGTITNVTTPHLIGTATAGLTVQIVNASETVLGSAIADASGHYSVQIASPLSDGTYALQARTLDGAGDLSALSAVDSLTIDTTAPAAPSTPILDPADDSGAKGDGITDVNLPRLTGTAAAGLTIQLLNASGAVIGSTVATASGTYSVAPSSQIPDGLDVMSVRAIDAAGNVSPASGTIALTILTVPPPVPSTPVLSAIDDSGTVGDNITVVTQPHLLGTAVPGSTVELLNAADAVIGSGSTDANGNYSVAPGAPLAIGVNVLSVVAVDVAGNVSPASPTLSLTIVAGLTTPGTPSLLPADDSGVPGDNITNVNLPHFVGSATAGLTVQLVASNNAVIGSALVAANGTYSVQPGTPLLDGTDKLQVRVVDASGDSSALSGSVTVTILTQAPATPSAPTLNPADDTGVLGDNRTTIRRPRFIGVVAPGQTVDLLSASGTILAQTVASSTGAYSLQTAANLSTGTTTLSVQVVDVAGNVSLPSPGLSLTIADTVPGDFTGNGKTELSVFRPSTAQWLVTSTTATAPQVTAYGMTNLGDIPVPGDYNGTGTNELAVFRPSTAQWFIQGPNGLRVVTFGATGLFDIPVPGDYDNVGYTEPAVYRPSTGQWFVLGPNGSHVIATWGAPNLADIPVPGNYDGVGYTEPAVYRPSTGQWFVLGPNGGHVLGLPGFGALNLIDIPVPGDYYGVGHTEIAYFRPATAQWFVLGPNGPTLLATYGATGFFDYPTIASVGSMKRLGKVPGGVRAASITVARPAITAQSLGTTATVATVAAPVVAAPIEVAPAGSSKKPRSSATYDAVLGSALDSLYQEGLD